MDAKEILLSAITVFLGVLGKIIFDWLKGQKRDTTGDKDPEYWLEHLNEIKDILKARNVVFVGIESQLAALRESTGRIENRVDDAIRARSRGR